MRHYIDSIHTLFQWFSTGFRQGSVPTHCLLCRWVLHPGGTSPQLESWSVFPGHPWSLSPWSTGFSSGRTAGGPGCFPGICRSPPTSLLCPEICYQESGYPQEEISLVGGGRTVNFWWNFVLVSKLLRHAVWRMCRVPTLHIPVNCSVSLQHNILVTFAPHLNQRQVQGIAFRMIQPENFFLLHLDQFQ